MSDFWKSQRQLHKQLSLKKADHIAPSLSTYKLLTEQAYKKKPSQKVGTDWNLLLSTDNNKVYQNRNSGEVVNAVSGSKSLKDFTNDGLQYIGFLNNPLQKKRYKESENVINRLTHWSRCEIWQPFGKTGSFQPTGPMAAPAHPGAPAPVLALFMIAI